MVDKNIIVNNSILKGDSYFVVADAKPQRVDEASSDDQHELFQQPSLRIDCNAPEKTVLSKLSDNVQENVSENIPDLKTSFLSLKSFVMDELYSINVNLDHFRTKQCDQTK